MRRNLGVILALAAGMVVISGVVAPTGAQAVPGPGVIHTIRSVGAGLARPNSVHPQVDVCLDADTNTMGANGTKLQLWECNDTSQQNWYYEPVSGGQAVIKNSRAGAGYCLDADANTMGTNGTKIQLWQCNGTTQQLWTGFGTSTMKNVRDGAGFCLDADTNTIGGNGTKLQLWGCNSTEQQSWYLSSPFTATCKTAKISANGYWPVTSSGGQGIHISIVNASLLPVNVSATASGTLIYTGVIGPVGGSALVDWSEFGTPPLTYNITFAVSGPSISTIGIAVRSNAC